jgi:hypothetical protein
MPPVGPGEDRRLVRTRGRRDRRRTMFVSLERRRARRSGLGGTAPGLKAARSFHRRCSGHLSSGNPEVPVPCTGTPRSGWLQPTAPAFRHRVPALRETTSPAKTLRSERSAPGVAPGERDAAAACISMVRRSHRRPDPWCHRPVVSPELPILRYLTDMRRPPGSQEFPHPLAASITPTAMAAPPGSRSRPPPSSRRSASSWGFPSAAAYLCGPALRTEEVRSRRESTLSPAPLSTVW